jgi:hypothetical protein
VQRKAAASAAARPPTTFDAPLALTQGGSRLPASVRHSVAPLFGTDFADVRIHDDPMSYAAAREVQARAFTLGQHIYFAQGEYRPAQQEGMHLLAHELTHTVQQSGATMASGMHVGVDPVTSPLEHEAERVADHVSHEAQRAPRQDFGNVRVHSRAQTAITAHSALPSIQRVGIGEFFSRLLFEGTFSDQELLAYLKYLDDHAAIEGDYDSDNKAREIIRRWRAGTKLFRLTLPRKQLLLLEMIDGPTLDADEHAILELLRGSSPAEVLTLIGTAGGVEALRDEFHGSEADELDAFLAQWREDPRFRELGTGELGRDKVTVREVVVNQNTPQTVTVTYGNGRKEADICSTGKGTCCVEPGTDAGPTAAATQIDDTNWTPVGVHQVVKPPETDHKGIRWWTQFHLTRAIALHEYSPVDGTPLSHGCVRLHGRIAERIYRGSVMGRTTVRVVGIPRPRCGYGPVMHEWQKDFAGGSADDGDVELRKHLSVAFRGVTGAELDRRVDEGQVPRCETPGRRPTPGSGRTP